MFTDPMWPATLFVFVIGAIMGSFINVVGLRFLRDESVVLPASHCYHCDARIKPWDNIPILSWVLLGGKCRACKAGISWQYPAVELATALLFVATVHQFGWTWQTVFLLFLIGNLMVVLITDFREQYIFDVNSIGLVPFGLIYSGLNLGHVVGESTVVPWIPGLELPPGFLSAVMAIAVSFLIFWALNLYSKFVAGSEGFGEGDNRLLMGMGSFFGWTWIVMVFILGFFVQAAVGIPMMLVQWVRFKAFRSLGLMGLALLMALVPYFFQPLLPGPIAVVITAMLCGIVALWASIKAIRLARDLEIPLTAIPFGPALVLACLSLLFFGNSITPYFKNFLPV